MALFDINPCTSIGGCGSQDTHVSQMQNGLFRAGCKNCFTCTLMYINAIDAAAEWNNANPLPEIDEVTELADKLAECYELLDEVARSHYAISPLCAELLKKHRGN